MYKETWEEKNANGVLVERSCLKSKKDLQDEFYALRNDDSDFANDYKENEFEMWLSDNDIIKS